MSDNAKASCWSCFLGSSVNSMIISGFPVTFSKRASARAVSIKRPSALRPSWSSLAFQVAVKSPFSCWNSAWMVWYGTDLKASISRSLATTRERVGMTRPTPFLSESVRKSERVQDHCSEDRRNSPSHPTNLQHKHPVKVRNLFWETSSGDFSDVAKACCFNILSFSPACRAMKVNICFWRIGSNAFGDMNSQ